MTHELSPHAAHALSLGRFIDASPSPYHVVESGRRLLDEAGFSPADLETESSLVGKRYLVRDGSLIAWHGDPDRRPDSPLRIIGAHTDSPNLRLKPKPEADMGQFRRLGVEVYGGVLLNSWLDRDLGLSGRVVLRRPDGNTEVRLVAIDEPILRIPQLAIHLDRDINDKGLQLNKQKHLAPIYGLVGTGSDIMEVVAGALGVARTSIVASELMLHDTAPSALAGADREFLSAPRLDNQVSCHAALTALSGASTDATVPMVALFDHEEVGSVSQTGAATAGLPRLLHSLLGQLGAAEGDIARAIAGGLFVSADNAHATHPNYPERHEPQHHIDLNGGPTLKHNANQRYTTDAVSAAAFHLAAERAGVNTQEFVNRTDLACGSTIGPTVSASLGMRALDVGCPQLAMHSCRELAGTNDPWDLTLLLAELLRQ